MTVRAHQVRLIVVTLLAIIVASTAMVMDANLVSRAAIVATLCLFLWLSGWVPVWIPTLVLWCATPLLLGTADARFGVFNVLRMSIDPVLALFLAGFAFAKSAERHGLDARIAAFALRKSAGSTMRLVGAAAFTTALLSMWMSNVAAAALMLKAFHPILSHTHTNTALRASLLLSIALAADVGGIATPIGTGANGIAMAEIAGTHPISFLHWMAFGVPLALLLTAAALAFVLRRFRLASGELHPKLNVVSTKRSSTIPLLAIFVLTLVLWLSEPLHGISAWIVALAAVAALLLTRTLHVRDLRHLDWSTLILVAGGIGVGRLLEESGLVVELASRLPLATTPAVVRLLVLCLASATLSALMSNTATAALLIPLAAAVDPAPSTAIIVAIAASLGMPFVMSTPPNAMAVSAGLPSRELLGPGLLIMIAGCVVIALTGPVVLRAVGIP
ncbi:MAG: SLC13 family permease [Gemmatimonadaceae bacterium]